MNQRQQATGAGSEQTAARSDETKRQIRGSTLLLAGQAFSVAVNLAVQLVIVRYLSKESFGAFAYALSVVAIAQTFAAFGIRHALGRFVPMYEEAGDTRRAAGAIVFAIATVLSLGAIAAVSVIALRNVIAGDIGAPEAVALVSIMVLLAPCFALGTVLDGIFAVAGRPRVIVVRRFIFVPLLRLLAVGAMVLIGLGPVMLAWSYLAIELIGIAAYALLLAPLLRERGLRPSDAERGRPIIPARRMLGFAAPLLSNDLTATFLIYGGGILLGLMAGADEVGSLRAVLPVALTLSYIASSFGTLFLPIASRLHSQGDEEELRRLYWATTTWTTVIAFPIFAITTMLAEPVTVLLFGERYAESAPVLAMLTLGLFISTATGFNSLILGVFGETRIILATNLAALATSITLTLLLIPSLGAFGAAIAMATAYAVLNGLRQVAMARRTGVAAVDRDFLEIAAWMIVPLVVGLGLEALLSPPVAVTATYVAATSVAVIVIASRRLGLLRTFPELAANPVVRKFRRWRGAGA